MDVIFSALSLAAIYGLVAIGVSLTWAALGMLNLAHGVAFAVGAYGGWLAADHLSDSAPVVLAGGVAGGALVGCAIYLLVVIPLYDRPNWETRHLIATLAISLVGANLLLELFGPSAKALPAVFGEGSVTIAGSVVTADKLGAIVSAAVVLGAVAVVLRRSRLGLGLRVLTQDSEGAALVGVSRNRMALGVLALSGGLAGLASVLLAQTFYANPDVGFVPLVKGLLVAVLGGLGSIPGAIVAALVMGVAEALTATYLGQEYVLMTLFVVLAVVLLVRPRGIAGLLEEARA